MDLRIATPARVRHRQHQQRRHRQLQETRRGLSEMHACTAFSAFARSGSLRFANSRECCRRLACRRAYGFFLVRTQRMCFASGLAHRMASPSRSWMCRRQRCRMKPAPHPKYSTHKKTPQRRRPTTPTSRHPPDACRCIEAPHGRLRTYGTGGPALCPWMLPLLGYMCARLDDARCVVELPQRFMHCRRRGRSTPWGA